MNFPVFVDVAVTGSVAIYTNPNLNPPNTICCKGFYWIYAFKPRRLKISPITTPPTKNEDIILQLPIPVEINIIAPIKIAIADVSPIEPGIVPISELTISNSDP